MDVSAEQVGIFVLVVVALVPAVDKVVGWFRRGEKQQRLVSLETVFATSEELTEAKQDLNGRIQVVDAKVERVDGDVKGLRESIVSNGEVRRKSIEGKVEALRLEVKQDVAQLHEKVNEVGQQLAAVDQRAELTGQQMAQLTGQIQRMLEARAQDRERIGI